MKFIPFGNNEKKMCLTRKKKPFTHQILQVCTKPPYTQITRIENLPKEFNGKIPTYSRKNS
jgi:hypothetical protein